jgi:TolB-like protein
MSSLLINDLIASVPRSVAVLPFFTSSTSPDAEYLADGISETLINNLAQLRCLRVVARSTVFRHKGKDVDPIQIGQELGVSAVLSGRIFQRGDILVIAAELVRVADGSQLWGQQYKRQMTDIFSIEDEISTEISGRLRVRFTESEQVRLTRHYTENPEAYQLYLRGRPPRIKAMMVEEATTAQVVGFRVNVSRQAQAGNPPPIMRISSFALRSYCVPEIANVRQRPIGSLCSE